MSDSQDQVIRTAPVEIEQQPSYLPCALATFRLAAAAYASYTVGRSLYRAHNALTPCQDTRRRISQRSKLSAAFGSFAGLGLLSAITSTLKYLTLSYKVWASQKDIKIPDSLWKSRVTDSDTKNATDLYLARWLSDTPVYLDALEIIAEKTRRLWWGQQLDLATIAWTALLAIEGRRCRIPHLWAYALLPHLVSLSFAQNLFYVALLQTPAPIPSEETRLARFFHQKLPRKPHNWFPKLSLILVPLILSYSTALWLPYAAGTSWFPTVAYLSKLLTLSPLILPAIAPSSWGTVHSDPHEAHPDIAKLFNVISAASALLHAKNTVCSLLYNLPGSYKHRHSAKIPFDVEKRTKWERTATAVEKVLGSMADHPVVAATGKDVLLSALSLGLWAAVHRIDISDMLRCVCPVYKSTKHSLVSALEHAKSEVAKAKTETSSLKEEESHKHEQEPEPEPEPTPAMTLRRRGRPAKSVNGPGEETAHQTPKRRGRPKKTVTAAVKSELEQPEQDDDAASEDKTFQPTQAVKREVESAGSGDVLLPQDDFDWEPAALAWGLAVLGGLGAGSAAVFGGECMAE